MQAFGPDCAARLLGTTALDLIETSNRILQARRRVRKGFLRDCWRGGRTKETTFVLLLKDGRKLLATVDNKAYVKMAGSVM